MKYTGKKLNKQIEGKDVYAVCFRSGGKGKYLVDTVCNNLLQAQQDALSENITYFEDQKRKAYAKLESIVLKTSEVGDGIYLERNKTDDGSYTHCTNLGDLLA